MIQYKNIVGIKPSFLKLSKNETVDINDSLDFELAKLIYKKNQKNYNFTKIFNFFFIYSH